MIETTRCVLNDPHPDDFEELLQIYTDAELRRYLGGPIEEQAAREGLTAFFNREVIPPNQWVIRRKSDQAFLGFISLRPHIDEGEIELSYELLPKWWGNGYATEVAQAVLDHGFETMNLDRIIAETQTANAASRRLLDRLGMQLESTLIRFDAEQAIYGLNRPK